jgi:hypothetical protein
MDVARNEGATDYDDETEYVWCGCETIGLDPDECSYFIDDCGEKAGKRCKVTLRPKYIDEVL